MRLVTSILIALGFLALSLILSFALSSWLPIPVLLLFVPFLFIKTWRR